ncbi:MAG: amino acid permease [Acidimicrobiales bacterium]
MKRIDVVATTTESAMTDSQARSAEDQSQKLGTFGGVFTPSLLTILGLVLFLRVGFVTGSVGLLQMLVIIVLATAVSLLTTVSLAAIATNLRVGGGGVYFLISRTLGPAFGGAIGLVLYLAMSVSVAFYTIGLGEAVASVVGSENEAFPRLVAAATIVLLVGIAWLGADIATRLQYVVMVCLGVALVAFFVGIAPELGFDQLGRNLGAPSNGGSFWVSFAIFFPAITGFTQGVAMSGDLRTPSRSITSGTFMAIGLSTAIYLLAVIAFAMAVPLSELRADTAIMRRLSYWPVLVDVGVIAATLSSAIASILGAPRTLQRLAGDQLIKPLRLFEVGSGPNDNPRRAMLLSAAIALVTVAVGDLDLVAPIISMFFLASYGLINYATYSEARAANTSFRPTFKIFDWRLSLLGTVACVGAIVAIDPVAGALAGLAILALYRYLQRTVQQARWSDSTRGFHVANLRSNLQMMETHADDGRDWRPCTVVFAPRDHERRARLIEVASWIEGGAGFTTVARIIPGRGPVARKHAARVQLELHRELSYRNNDVYDRVVVASDLQAGASAMLQAHGIGALRPNLSLFSWFNDGPADSSNVDGYQSLVQTAQRFGCSVGVVHMPDAGWSKRPKDRRTPSTIVVWWADDSSGQFLTLLAWMCTRASIWGGATVWVWVDGLDEAERARVAGLLSDARIPAHVSGVAQASDLLQRVEGADLVFAPLRISKGVSLGPGDVPLDQLVDKLPMAIFAQTPNEVPLDLQPDDTSMILLAEARDRATQATARANEFDTDASRLMVEAEMVRLRSSDGADDPQVIESVTAAGRAHRRYLDARARADEAWRLVTEIDPASSNDRVDPNLWIEAPKPAPEQPSR